MIESLEAIRKSIQEYKSTPDATGDQIVDWLRIITTHQFTIAEAKAEFYKSWQNVVYDKLTSDGMAVSRAENIADIRVPELTLLRHVLKASEDVVDALRSHLSHLKQQKQNV